MSSRAVPLESLPSEAQKTESPPSRLKATAAFAPFPPGMKEYPPGSESVSPAEGTFDTFITKSILAELTVRTLIFRCIALIPFFVADVFVGVFVSWSRDPPGLRNNYTILS
jgi:hypothetical protein